MNEFQNSIDPDTFRETANAIEAEVGKVIVGQEPVVRHVLIGILSRGHVLLEGVPGLGKTILIRSFGQAMALNFSRVQFTPDLMPADITGTEIMEDTGDGHRAFRFQRGPLFANLVLADEINRATPKTQSALLEAMQEHTVTAGNATYPLPAPFFVLATQNPIEQEGTYPLPEAQLDRFMFKVNVPFPTENDLVEIISRTTSDVEPSIKAVVSDQQLLAMQDFARRIPVPSPVSQYVGRLVIATHPASDALPAVGHFVRYGASPRSAQSMILGAKVTALLDGRFNVSFEDIAAIAPATLRHRLLLNFEGQAEGISPDDIITELIKTVPAYPTS
ncbi:MAG: MoxR family ATPase [Anaerolineae bacterium]|nr:MoxR family ATPase [Anaerolineae bacterium]